MSLTPGRRLGRFEILGELGAGGMGTTVSSSIVTISRGITSPRTSR